ncbi:DUF2732 family protein [Gilliamella sp. Pra-s65]|uniref:DUF2732 family protein n=1 Tax=unclassified Gilliamella TaxID=2685620 RepID=UPI00136642F5|nr:MULTISPECIES: DUF2732 family protein [unclassified Gilliamella]MWN89888.1 DUF2732 family protein [Gilliamella sp. Pra-s65]MWP73060.1 DUF2732 family protein [Gilliamella sp. Pra-s52]
MEMTTLKGDALLQALNQAKEETKSGLCDVFTAKLERLATHIRTNYLTPTESAELLEQEAEAMKAQHRNDI